MESIYYAQGMEKQDTSRLYRQMFPEDSREFVEYYYRWKTRDNHILVMKDQGRTEVMLHRNPYWLQVCRSQAVCDYIVAVATLPECRRKGKMQQVMEQALLDMYQAGQPFAFLLPADPAYYRGQGFVYIPCRPKGQGTGSGIPEGFQYRPAELTDAAELAEFANRTLAAQWDVFALRDQAYFERLLAETASEGGKVIRVEQEGKVTGILSYGMETAKGQAPRAELKEVILPKQYQNQALAICSQALGTVPVMQEPMHLMVRVTRLERLCAMLRKSAEYVRKVRVEDPIIPENSGCFEIRIGPKQSSFLPIPEQEITETMGIAALTEELFQNIKCFINEWV